MSDYTADIFIAGAGPAGLSAACAFGAAGYRVVIADPSEPVTQASAKGADLRSTAILRPGRELLETAGVWDHLAGAARPLRAMRITDISSEQVTRDFASADLGFDAFGWNLSNLELRSGLLARLASLDQVTPLFGQKFDAMTSRSDEIILLLSGGDRVRAKLAIACDGRSSPMRQAAGIEITRKTRGQRAVVFAVTHPKPHDFVSTEIHKSGGPFTLVPLPDHEGAPCSAVVWMASGPECRRLAALPKAEFEREATERSAALCGDLTLVSERQTWPISSQIADRFTAPRLALAAEAAHAVPPIGAQGLNMSLADIAALLRLADGNDPGAPGVLARYERERRRDALARIEGVNLLNMASQSDNASVQALRSTGIKLLHDVAPLRKFVMRLGLG